MTASSADAVFMIGGLMIATCLALSCVWCMCMYRLRVRPPPPMSPSQPVSVVRKFYVVDHPGGERGLAV